VESKNDEKNGKVAGRVFFKKYKKHFCVYKRFYLINYLFKVNEEIIHFLIQECI
jgi:hypothetical protein